MKTIYVRVLFAFFGLAAFAVATQAQELDQIIVNVPYNFVVSGKTLPAGTYRINRGSDHVTQVLAITGIENSEGVLLVSSEVTSTREDKPSLTFQHIGDQYVLSKIETAEHIFTVPVSAKAATQVVAMKKQTSPSASSSSGSN